MPQDEESPAVPAWTMRRRDLLIAAGAIPTAAAAAAIGLDSTDTPPPADRTLQLRPPELNNPRQLIITNDLLRRTPNFDLKGWDFDWVVELPKDAYLQYGLSLNGLDQARNIVIIGGGIELAPTHDRSTMLMLDGSGWAAYAQRSFSGATGGTFRFQIWEKSYKYGLALPFTVDLPWDATPDMIAKALEDVAGAGSVQAVDGPKTPGGPWKIVPTSKPLLGRVVMDTGGLTGEIKTTYWNFLNPAIAYGLKLRQWRGTLHCEGLHIHGDQVCDGIEVQTQWKDAVLQLANVHAAPRFHDWHDDWVHCDGMQTWLGSSEMRMENVDLVSLGGNGFIAQPFVGGASVPLQNLRDWWLRNCHFRAIMDDRNGRAADASASCWRQEDFPVPGKDLTGQRWIAEHVYCSRTRASDGAAITSDPRDKYYWYKGEDTADITIGSPVPTFFADPAKSYSGPGYVSPGYAGDTVEQGTLRVVGQRRV